MARLSYNGISGYIVYKIITFQIGICGGIYEKDSDTFTVYGLFCGLVGCGVKPVSDAKINYGSSSIYSEEDMNAAIELIKEEFSTWEGCELHDIFYSSDDEVNEENIAWMNELAKGQNLSPDFTQCIMFKSNFHSPKNGGGAWNADEEYTDWQWWLARTEGGDWKLLTWGY